MAKLFQRIKKEIIENKYLFGIIIFYFSLRLINLTTPPPFNDESIYLDWGWREVDKTGFLYYSLYDAKQPFLMWIFGIMQKILADPLFAGRIVSVVTGFLTLLGIYKISKYLFSRQIGLVSSLIYSVIPIFTFYDRQVLMESAIATIGIWSCLFFLKAFREKSIKYSLFLGIVLGIGFFIKSTAFIFLSSYIALFSASLFFVSKKMKRIENLFVSIGAVIGVTFLLLINPTFWETLSSNSRYSFTISEVFGFPIATWFSSAITNMQIAFFYLTPLVFIFSIIGIIFIFQRKKKDENLFLLFFLLSLLTVTILVRSATDRYLVSFLPFLVIPCSYLLHLIYEKKKTVAIVLFSVLIFISLSLSIFQIINQPSYIQLMGKYTKISNITYLEGFSSGYGVDEVIDYLNEVSKDKKILVSVAENTGNPESAMFVFFNKNKNIDTVYLDTKLLTIDTNQYSCMSSETPIYFVSRDNQQGGFEKFMQKIRTFKNPHGTNTIGIFTLKTNCIGESFKLELQDN